MMRTLLAAIFASLVVAPSLAGEISSEYTELDTQKDCVTFAAAEEGDGDWTNLVCNGYRGYPVLIYAADARESLFYGFPPAGDLAPVWESFSAFNAAGPRIEWRIDIDGDKTTPFATIHRRHVAGPDDEGDPEKRIEVLVVSRVSQIAEREGCVVGLVVATGNPTANDMARKIADEQAPTFVCGADQRTQVSGDIALPEFSRTEN